MIPLPWSYVNRRITRPCKLEIGGWKGVEGSGHQSLPAKRNPCRISLNKQIINNLRNEKAFFFTIFFKIVFKIIILS